MNRLVVRMLPAAFNYSTNVAIILPTAWFVEMMSTLKHKRETSKAKILPYL